MYKLIRVDEPQPFKIQLVAGKHVVGRGKFFLKEEYDTDQRVSRNHCELEIIDDSITLKSIHKNPCFHKKAGSDPVFVVQENKTISLNHTDQFGLLPDKFWYQVIYCGDLDSPDKEEETEDQNGLTTSGATGSGEETQEYTVEIGYFNTIATTKIFIVNTESAEPFAVLIKRSHDSNDSSPEDVKKAKTEPATPDGTVA